MATISILKNVNLRSKPLCRNFVSSLDNAKKKKAKQVLYTGKVSQIPTDKIKDFFEDF